MGYDQNCKSEKKIAATLIDHNFLQNYRIVKILSVFRTYCPRTVDSRCFPSQKGQLEKSTTPSMLSLMIILVKICMFWKKNGRPPQRARRFFPGNFFCAENSGNRQFSDSTCEKHFTFLQFGNFEESYGRSKWRKLWSLLFFSQICKKSSIL